MSLRFAANTGGEQKSLNPVNTSRTLEPEGLSDEQFRDQLYRVLAVNRNILPQLLARSMVDNVNPETIMHHLGLLDIFKQIEQNIQQRFDQLLELVSANHQRTIELVQRSVVVDTTADTIAVATADTIAVATADVVAGAPTEELRNESSTTSTSAPSTVIEQKTDSPTDEVVDDVEEHQSQDESTTEPKIVELDDDEVVPPANFDPSTSHSTSGGQPPTDPAVYPATLT